MNTPIYYGDLKPFERMAETPAEIFRGLIDFDGMTDTISVSVRRPFVIFDPIPEPVHLDPAAVRRLALVLAELADCLDDPSLPFPKG